jgi:hypothetical protein
MSVMKTLAGACAAGAVLVLTACGGGSPSVTPAPTTAPGTSSAAFPVYTQSSSSYNALLVCIFDAGYNIYGKLRASRLLAGASVRGPLWRGRAA